MLRHYIRAMQVVMALIVLVAVTIDIHVVWAGSDEEASIYPVKTFCDFDSKGARLSSAGYSSIPDVIIWEEGDPGWDSMVVISGYTIGAAQKTAEGFKVPVKFNVSGFLDGWSWTGAKDKMARERVAEQSVAVFNVVKVEGRWKAQNPGYPPHLSLAAALEFCRPRLKDYDNISEKQNDGQRPYLERTIKVLEKLNARHNK